MPARGIRERGLALATTVTITAAIARLYDASVGGKDNFAADRAACHDLLRTAPSLAELVRDERAWRRRVTRWLAGTAGVDQIIDCSPEFPQDSRRSLYETARLVNDDARVVYLAADPVLAAHARAQQVDGALGGLGAQAAVSGLDTSRLAELWDDQDVRGCLDPDRPVAVLNGCTWHHLPDDEQVRKIAAATIDALPSGSYLAVSHLYRPSDPAVATTATALEAALSVAMGSTRFRSREDICSYFDGLEPVAPGAVIAAAWWPEGPTLEPLAGERQLILTGLGRKP